MAVVGGAGHAGVAALVAGASGAAAAASVAGLADLKVLEASFASHECGSPVSSQSPPNRSGFFGETEYARPVWLHGRWLTGIVAHVRQRGDIQWVDYARELGIRLHMERTSRNLTQERLAEIAGMTRYHYQQLEKGESRPGTPANPSLKNIIALAQALEIEPTELIPHQYPKLVEG